MAVGQPPRRPTDATLDLLAQLVNKSLVIADQQGGQTLSAAGNRASIAVEQVMMDAQTQRQVQRRHSGYYLHLLAAQEEPLQRPLQAAALDLLRADFANIKGRPGSGQLNSMRLTCCSQPFMRSFFSFVISRVVFCIGIRLFMQAAAALQETMAGMRDAINASTLGTGTWAAGRLRGDARSYCTG
ncbi:MAG: hypothetical protein R2932_37760 [Caldilineaceae bacterium]